MTNPTDTGPGSGNLFEPVNESNTSGDNATSNEPVFSKVKLMMLYPGDVFQSGPDEENDVIRGRKGKVVSQEEAKNIKEIAEANGVILLEEGAE